MDTLVFAPVYFLTLTVQMEKIKANIHYICHPYPLGSPVTRNLGCLAVRSFLFVHISMILKLPRHFYNCLHLLSHVMRKPVMPNANNKGADQPVHPRSLISAFVVRCLDSRILPVSISELSSLCLPSVAAQAGLSLTWSKTPKTGFLVTRLYYWDTTG